MRRTHFALRTSRVSPTLACSSKTFKYDPFGRRIYKSSSSGTSVFAYDGDNLIEETNAAGGALGRYSHGLNIDEPLAMLRASATSVSQSRTARMRAARTPGFTREDLARTEIPMMYIQAESDRLGSARSIGEERRCCAGWGYDTSPQVGCCTATLVAV